jgi:3-hydroxyacyl-CoA dehydrogenase
VPKRKLFLTLKRCIRQVILDELNDKLKKKRMTNYEYVSTVSRLTPLHDESASWKRHFASADLVIEAVFEVRLFIAPCTWRSGV